MDWEPNGDMLSDLQNCIDHGNPINVQYIDKKGQASDRKALPLEIRGDGLYIADLDKMALRLFILSNITHYEVLDEFIDKDSLSLSTR